MARGLLFAIALLTLGDLFVFSDVLVPGRTTVPTALDVKLHGRLYEFAARHLAQGELPLWNPHLFCGTPALGNPNAMMLYPLTLLTVVLPLPTAITLATVAHTLLAGAFTFLWTTRRGLHPLGGALAASMVSFGGPLFGRIWAGHLSILAAMAWSPLVLLAADELVRRPSAGWVAIGALALAMQMLGGHPQYVFYSLMAAGLSVLLQLRGASRRGRVVGAFAAMVVWGLALAAIAIVPIVDALRQDGRAGGLAFGAASEFSLTWSSLLMLLVPDFYGHGGGTGYWGDWLYWETIPFVGIVGLAAAVYGAVRGDPTRRRFAGVLAVAFLVLALGSNTPLLQLLYDWIPPFDRLRSSARALFHFGVFTAMLAAVGIDALLRDRRPCRVLVVSLLVAAIGLATLAGWIRAAVSDSGAGSRREIDVVLRLPAEQREARIAEMAGDDTRRAERLRRAARAFDLVRHAADSAAHDHALEASKTPYVEAMSLDRWQDLRAWLVSTRGFSYSLEDWADPDAARRQAHAVIPRLLLAAAVCAATAISFGRAPRASNAVVGVVILGIAELLGYAWSTRTSFDVRSFRTASLVEFFREHPGDYRVHDSINPNGAMSVEGLDIWGDDPFVSARYVDYMAMTQGPDHRLGIGSFVVIDHPHRSFPMLRLQYVLAEEGDRVRVVAGPAQMPAPLPRVSLMHRYEVHDGRDAMLAALSGPGWDPADTVLLESEPNPTPVRGGRGTVTIRDESTDHLTIEAELDAPAILLVTDGYSEGWQVRPLETPGPQAYEVLPADYVLRAVPLAAGRHRIRMEYVPAYFRAGVMVSLAALALLMLVGGRVLSGRRAPPPAPPGARP